MDVSGILKDHPQLVRAIAQLTTECETTRSTGRLILDFKRKKFIAVMNRVQDYCDSGRGPTQLLVRDLWYILD